MQGYKAFDKNMKCRGFQFKEKETYSLVGKIELCGYGYHFCEKIIDCLNYYPLDSRFCEVRAGENTISDKNKTVTDEITIVRELKRRELRKLLYNQGEEKRWVEDGKLQSQCFYKMGN